MPARLITQADGTYMIEGVDAPGLRGPHKSRERAESVLALITDERWAEIAAHMGEAVAAADRLHASYEHCPVEHMTEARP